MGGILGTAERLRKFMITDTATLSRSSLIDIQKSSDERGIDIDHVGICDLRYPISVLDRANGVQQVAATFSISVSLPRHFKGTHMSRFIEVLAAHSEEVTMRTLPGLLKDLKTRLDAVTARVEVSFPYFVAKSAPVTGVRAPMDYECFFHAEANGHMSDFVFGVKVPVKSLCPCSKAISDYGAHNQRGIVTLQVKPACDSKGAPELIWIEELIEIAEKSASAPVYALLKREDERFVTMQAYDNPVFVEDMVRNVARHLDKDNRIACFEVRAVNRESIHNHSAFAVVRSSHSIL
jgi:GTP cyclohydrolase I